MGACDTASNPWEPSQGSPLAFCQAGLCFQYHEVEVGAVVTDSPCAQAHPARLFLETVKSNSATSGQSVTIHENVNLQVPGPHHQG